MLFKYSTLEYFPVNVPKYSGFNEIKLPNFITLYAQYKKNRDIKLAEEKGSLSLEPYSSTTFFIFSSLFAGSFSSEDINLFFNDNSIYSIIIIFIFSFLLNFTLMFYIYIKL